MRYEMERAIEKAAGKLIEVIRNSELSYDAVRGRKSLRDYGNNGNCISHSKVEEDFYKAVRGLSV